MEASYILGAWDKKSIARKVEPSSLPSEEGVFFQESKGEVVPEDVNSESVGSCCWEDYSILTSEKSACYTGKSSGCNSLEPSELWGLANHCDTA